METVNRLVPDHLRDLEGSEQSSRSETSPGTNSDGDLQAEAKYLKINYLTNMRAVERSEDHAL